MVRTAAAAESHANFVSETLEEEFVLKNYFRMVRGTVADCCAPVKEMK